MLKEDKITTALAAHDDMVSLLKMYARLGYDQAHNDLGEKFEELWDQAFPAEEHTVAPPEALQSLRFPRRA